MRKPSGAASEAGARTTARAPILRAALALVVLAAAQLTAADVKFPAIIPQPARMEFQEGAFQFRSGTRIVTDIASQSTGRQLAERLRPAMGFAFKFATADKNTAVKNAIVLTTNGADAKLGAEGYTLTVRPEGVVIRATDQAGLFYGAQTLLQLLPPEAFAANRVRDVEWSVPCVEIEDNPRFQWRGLMLDASRHFITKKETKRLLDAMAMLKINTFHWHLVDDHGWRIEIKQHPRLTKEGAWRPPGGFGFKAESTPAYGPDGRYGGFYTQDDVREIVAYAAERHITVIPEIEMPGHSTAALMVYPELSCSGGPFTIPLVSGVTHGIYCAGQDGSFEFLQEVLSEVFALFPAKYIHIGGDEVPKDNWKKCPRCQARMKTEGLATEHELQSWFIRRMEKFINANGRNLIGWSEIREGGLAQNATVMDWIGGGLEAAREGHDVVMTPTEFCYFDYYQSRDQAAEPKAMCCYLPLQKVYSFEPIPAGLPSDRHAHILGAQGNVWTEYIPNFEQVEYMTFPRLCALAEVVWSPKESRGWNDFTNRLSTHERRLDQVGVNYRRDTSVALGEWEPAQIQDELTTLDWDVTSRINGAGEYRITLEYTAGNHGIRIASVALLEDGREVARDAHDGFAGAHPRHPVYVLDLPARKAGARYTLQASVKGEGGTDSRGTVLCVSKPKF